MAALPQAVAFASTFTSLRLLTLRYTNGSAQTPAASPAEQGKIPSPEMNSELDESWGNVTVDGAGPMKSGATIQIWYRVHGIRHCVL